MSKLNLNPEFTADDANAKPVEEVKEDASLDADKGEETPTEPSEENKQTEVVETITDDKTTSESEKLTALEALRKTEEDLNKDTSELDKEIEARRQRIVEKRRERREKRDLVEKIGEKLPETEVDKLDDIDSTTLSILERYTKAKGLVPRDELDKRTYDSQHKTSEETFYDKHKEYLPENDKDDFLYKALQTELALYAKPSDPKLIPKLFEKAHSEVKKLYPKFFKDTTINDKVNASQRINTSSMGGGNTGGSSKQTPKSDKAPLSAYQIQALQQGGFSEEDIERMNSK